MDFVFVSLIAAFFGITWTLVVLGERALMS